MQLKKNDIWPNWKSELAFEMDKKWTPRAKKKASAPKTKRELVKCHA